jgi:protein-tyrosine phosphatase
MKVFWVSRRLAFGSAISTWEHVRGLHEMGLTHVINLRSSRRYRTKLRSFHGLWLPFPDDKEPRPAWFYRDALRFYKWAIDGSDSKVFVMCHRGICRSASLTYFLLRASGFTHSRAESVVLRVRPCAIICRAYRECGENFLALHRAQKKQSNGKHTKSHSGAST